MANYLNPLLGCALLLLAAAAPATAQLSDPTRPALDESAVAVGGNAAAPVSTGLQTILRRRGARPAAIINGEYVELGARLGESRLTAIGEDSVVLSGPGGKETLAMTPGIAKKPSRPAKKTRKPVGTK